MKYIMAKTSSSDLQGVPSFEYSPTITQPYLLPPYLPLDQLKSELLDTFQGKSLSVLDIYNQHNVGTYYIKNNYKQALLQLEMQGDLGINPSAEKRPKRAGETTLGDKVIINFPKKKE